MQGVVRETASQDVALVAPAKDIAAASPEESILACMSADDVGTLRSFASPYRRFDVPTT